MGRNLLLKQQVATRGYANRLKALITQGKLSPAMRSAVHGILASSKPVLLPLKLLAGATKADKAAFLLASRYVKAWNSFKARQAVAAIERARRAKAAAAKYAQATKVQQCKLSQFGTPLPQTGSWSGVRGNSVWTSSVPIGGVYPQVPFANGYPQFDKSVPKSIYVGTDASGQPVPGIVSIGQEAKSSDFTAARDAMREQLGDPNWPQSVGPTNAKGCAPDGFTWHHVENSVTMQLVARAIHDKAQSGPAHAGGESIVAGKDMMRQPTQF